MSLFYRMLLLQFIAISSTLAKDCIQGIACKECLPNRVKPGHFGQIFCCSGCAETPTIRSANGRCSCSMVKDEPNKSSRIIFEGTRKHASQSLQNVREVPSRVRTVSNRPVSAPFIQDNQALESEVTTTVYNTESLGKAIGLMATAVEKLDLRLRRVEETLGQINLLKFGVTPIQTGNLDRADSNVLPFSDNCREKFMHIGGNLCVFASVWTNERANWKDAQLACERLGANLAETLNHSQFVSLANFLSSTTSTAGYSYWLGGVYPGALWVWLSNGKEVTLNRNVWTTVRRLITSDSSSTIAGNVGNGRCLGFHYVMEKETYNLAGDECGYEKFYLCEAPAKK